MDPSHSFRMEVDGLDLQQGPVLSLDQIRAIRAHNDYVDRPVALELASQSGFFYAHDERHPHGIYSQHPQSPRHTPLPRSQSQQHTHISRLSSSSTVSSFISRTSGGSDQRLLAGLTPSHSGLASVVRAQPKGELKHDASLSKILAEEELGRHQFICERCARCKCQDCCTSRRLPSCWACGQRCLCSAESMVEYGTCLCCIKGLFYHCSAQDDEDNCADQPCSCAPTHALARWGIMGLLAVCLPCLCCYPPARLCLSLCRCAYDRATRPGCRCSNTNTVCRKISASNPSPGHPTMSKAVEKSL
ncbi:protein sprouty homolog 3 [Syngnathoides biaculeatus]|uniref:protein sprouty homolog 3 n=1 Tax=Syngnathoides biaculeatus TaxID=300417 RepID=UPI002ADDA93D|nr:protein sprouty homolog 3 [Syngnathoides biaculeatus]